MSPVNRIVVEKTERRLTLIRPGQAGLVFGVRLGRNWHADKAVEGDQATPVGEFYVCARNPNSRFHLSLCISYPNDEDAERGYAAGLIDASQRAQILEAIGHGRMPPQKTRLGGEIYIHGEPNSGSVADGDWTRGCIALANPDMRIVYDAADVGTGVTILR